MSIVPEIDLDTFSNNASKKPSDEVTGEISTDLKQRVLSEDKKGMPSFQEGGLSDHQEVVDEQKRV